MTLFKHILSRVGLSHAEAAEYIEVSKGTIDSWASGRNAAKAFAFNELAKLSSRQEDEAQKMLETWTNMGKPDEFVFDMATNNDEAKEMGWPSATSHATVAAVFWELTGVIPTISARGKRDD